MQLLITVALVAEKEKKATEITVCSPSLPHLKRGARKDFLEIMEDWEMFDEEKFNRTDNVYSFGKSYIEFFGVDDATKVRGPGRDILFINEAILISEASYRQMAMRTRQTVFMDYNPADEFNYVYGVADSPDTKIIRSTYENNLANLPRWQVEEIESLRGVDANLWKVFGLGLRGTSSETIYTHWQPCAHLPEGGLEFFGLDFGFNVPTALVRIKFYEGRVYGQQLLYETHLTTSDLIERLKGLGTKRTDEIFCDAAEPKTIKELQQAGFNAKPADKDVTEGIRKVKGLPLYLTSDSTDAIKEIKSYKWKIGPPGEDGKGRVLDEPVKFHDHLMDAIRYGVFTKLSKPLIKIVAY